MLIDLKQNTPEWHQYRNQRIGATDFAAIAACNDYSKNIFNKTIKSLIENKLNPQSFTINKYFQRGIDFENKYLNELNLIDLVKGEIIQYEHNNRIYCSLDARDNFNNTIIEIKTTSKPLDCFDELMQYYQYQVLHQCYCANASQGIIYIAFFDNNDQITEIKLFTVKPENIMPKSMWLHMCENFLNTFDSYNNAPKNILDLWNKYNHFDQQIKKMELEKELLKQDLINICNGNKYYKEFYFEKYTRKNIKYSEYIKDLNINVPENYISESTIYKLKGNNNE